MIQVASWQAQSFHSVILTPSGPKPLFQVIRELLLAQH